VHVAEQVIGPGPCLLPLTGAPWSAPGRRDALDVSLHDNVLAEEVELTARLIVAANEVERPLARDEVDDILEVARSARRARP
jgi:hypothetical protein